MNRLYLLDTNTIIYILRRHSEAARHHLANLAPNESAAVSVITEAEIHYGIAKSQRGSELEHAFQLLLPRVHLLPWTSNEASIFGPLRVKQEKAGRSLGHYDLQIAAQAITHRAIVVSNDKAFTRVPDLLGVENWATDLSQAARP